MRSTLFFIPSFLLLSIAHAGTLVVGRSFQTLDEAPDYAAFGLDGVHG